MRWGAAQTRSIGPGVSARWFADRSDIDVNGNPSTYTHSVGSGVVVLFRGGERIQGTRSRASIGAPTLYQDSAGKPLLFAPGGTFVALVHPGASA